MNVLTCDAVLYFTTSLLQDELNKQQEMRVAGESIFRKAAASLLAEKELNVAHADYSLDANMFSAGIDCSGAVAVKVKRSWSPPHPRPHLLEPFGARHPPVLRCVWRVGAGSFTVRLRCCTALDGCGAVLYGAVPVPVPTVSLYQLICSSTVRHALAMHPVQVTC